MLLGLCHQLRPDNLANLSRTASGNESKKAIGVRLEAEGGFFGLDRHTNLPYKPELI
jgi:hypothetical protein